MNQQPQTSWPAPPPGGGPTPDWQAPPHQPGPAAGVQFAPHGERLVAYIVDSLILSALLLVFVLVFVAVYFVSAARGSNSTIGIFALIVFTVLVFASLAYFPFFWVRGGQTPGMKLFGLYVVRDSDGGPIGWGAAILRLIGYWIDALAFYLGYIWIFIDSRRRGWHDLIAGTLVIKR
jgi:uncharacterized RDD family membrane protein YckC